MNVESREFRDKVVEIIKQRVALSHYRIFIFGSRANRKASNRSDIDVGIESIEPISASVKLEIKSELAELPIMQKIDFVDFNGVNQAFKEIALQNIEVIYEK